MIWEDWTFCDWILRGAATSDKKLKVSIFNFFNLNSSFVQNIFYFKIHSPVAFQKYQIYQIQIYHIFKKQK